MTTRTFTREELVDELGLPCEPYEDKVTIISDEISDHGRWDMGHTIISQLADQPADEAWLTHYAVVVTESQWQAPWEHEDHVTAKLVKRVEKIVEVWE